MFEPPAITRWRASHSWTGYAALLLAFLQWEYHTCTGFRLFFHLPNLHNRPPALGIIRQVDRESNKSPQMWSSKMWMNIFGHITFDHQKSTISKTEADDIVDGRNPANQLIGCLSYDFQGFMYASWLAGFLPSTVAPFPTGPTF